MPASKINNFFFHTSNLTSYSLLTRRGLNLNIFISLVCFFRIYKKSGYHRMWQQRQTERRKKKSHEHTKKIHTHYVGGRVLLWRSLWKKFFIEFMSVLDSTRDYCLKECDKIFFFPLFGTSWGDSYWNFTWIELDSCDWWYIIGDFIAFFVFFILDFFDVIKFGISLFLFFCWRFFVYQEIF